MSAPDDFCHANTPDDLRKAVRDIAQLQQWVKGRSEDQLMDGFESIYPHHTVQRQIVREAIEHARHRESIEAARAAASEKNTIGQPKQHVPIFVGSTYEDLIEYRHAVGDALHRLETIVRGMEYFGSKPGSPKEECLKAVRSCRLYIGIFAMRYGSIDEQSGKSMTHLEFDEAEKLELPSLMNRSSPCFLNSLTQAKKRSA